jgi:hypothetical protein
MTHFKKYLCVPGTVSGHLLIKNGPMANSSSQDAIPGISYIVERFESPQRDLGPGARQPVLGNLILAYIAKQGDKEQHCVVPISLVATPCNYGGHRWWMLSPCCGAKVRAVYIGGKNIYLTCRECQDLHYQSQRASYIERQIAYEKHLLSNYGYAWAAHEYHNLKEHYFKITPEYLYKARKSELERELHFMRRLIEFDRVMLKTDLRAVRSLKSDEDKQVYLEHRAQQIGRGYALDLVKMLGLGIQFRQAILEEEVEIDDSHHISDEMVETAIPETEFAPSGDEEEMQTRKMLFLVRKEQALEQEIKFLEKKAA